MSFVRERLSKWVEAAIILAVGILCIVAGAAMHGQDFESAKGALEGISLTLGIILIVVGSLAVILGIVIFCIVKKGFLAVALPGSALLAIGISLVVSKYAAEFIFIILTVIPYLMICMGTVILVEAIMNLVLAIKAKSVKGALFGIIVMMVIAVAATVLGALCVGTKPVIPTAVQLIIFGIVVCLVACLQVLLTFVKLPDAVVIVKTEEKKEEK